MRGLSASLCGALAVLSIALPAPAAQAAECPNQPLREEQPHALALPDCRAYEQVSPVDKGGVDAKGDPGQMQASADGSRVRFYSILPFPGSPSSQVGLPTYISSRNAKQGTWSTASAMPESPRAQVRGFSEDLSEGVVWAESTGPEGQPLERRTYYLHDIANGTFTRMFSWDEGVSEGAVFSLGGFSADGTKMFFESGLHLLPQARQGQLNAYQWDTTKPPGEQLSLVGVLPESEGNEAPVEGSILGASAGAKGPTTLAPARSYTQSAISSDGSRVFFTALPSGRIYARLRGQSTIAISPGEAEFLGATPDGRYAFYTEAGALYRYDLGSEEPALEGPPLALTSPTAEALGTLGFSDDGSTVYFAAAAVLAENTNPEGERGDRPNPAAANLYEWHQQSEEAPTITFIASLSNMKAEFGDAADWRNRLGSQFPGACSGTRG